MAALQVPVVNLLSFRRNAMKAACAPRRQGKGAASRACRGGICCLVIIAASLLLLAVITIRSDSQRLPSQPIVILKLPRSGSSWLVERMNSLPSVYISKEIMQGSDVGGHSYSDIESHFIRALISPTDKLSRSKSLLPSGRYVEDYLFHRSGKVLSYSNLDIIGFSLNAEHCPGLNWANIINKIPNLKIVLLKRRNIIKTALSAKSGMELKRLCGTSNIRKDDKALKCFESYKTSSHQVTWNINNFVNDINFWLNRTASFSNALLSDPHLSTLPQTVIFYESLQTNFISAVSGMLQSLGRKLPAADGALLEQPLGSSWSKRSGEDLSEVIANYQELVAVLSADVGCECLLRHLTSRKISNKVDLCSTKQLSYDPIIKSITCSNM